MKIQTENPGYWRLRIINMPQSCSVLFCFFTIGGRFLCQRRGHLQGWLGAQTEQHLSKWTSLEIPQTQVGIQPVIFFSAMSVCVWLVGLSWAACQCLCKVVLSPQKTFLLRYYWLAVSHIAWTIWLSTPLCNRFLTFGSTGAAPPPHSHHFCDKNSLLMMYYQMECLVYKQ